MTRRNLNFFKTNTYTAGGLSLLVQTDVAVEDAGTGNAGPPVAALRVGDVVDLGLHQRVGG